MIGTSPNLISIYYRNITFSTLILFYYRDGTFSTLISFYYRDRTFSTLISFYYHNVTFFSLISIYYRDGTFSTVMWLLCGRPWVQVPLVLKFCSLFFLFSAFFSLFFTMLYLTEFSCCYLIILTVKCEGPKVMVVFCMACSETAQYHIVLYKTGYNWID